MVGTVSGLDIGPAQDRLVLTLTDGVTAYVPFVKRIVPAVADDHVVVDPPAGLSTSTARPPSDRRQGRDP